MIIHVQSTRLLGYQLKSHTLNAIESALKNTRTQRAAIFIHLISIWYMVYVIETAQSLKVG